MRRHSPLLEGLGRAVRAAREKQELTRQALAERAGVSLRYLAQLEGGTGNISVSKLDDVARELGMPAAALLAPRGEPAAGLLGPPGEPAAEETGSGLLREIVGTLAGRPLEELREVLSHLRGSAPTAGQGRVIALMGLRGAGKSTLGPLLAERLAVPLHELDRLIEQLRPHGITKLVRTGRVALET
ncbi:MAG: helix-turn-helix domain-containing protein [SAR324 cluster bacterium]|nr:helix-turn-helix domain-containing protein [SAR324 cluster bacterium]